MIDKRRKKERTTTTKKIGKMFKYNAERDCSMQCNAMQPESHVSDCAADQQRASSYLSWLSFSFIFLGATGNEEGEN
jgi:hypothetical protein